MSAPRWRGSGGEERGVTLLELLVALAILGVAAGVAGLAFHRWEPRPAPDEAASRVAAARAEALTSGRPTTVRIDREGTPYWATALPDGTVIAEAPLAVERLTGRTRHAR